MNRPSQGMMALMAGMALVVRDDARVTLIEPRNPGAPTATAAATLPEGPPKLRLGAKRPPKGAHAARRAARKAERRARKAGRR